MDREKILAKSSSYLLEGALLLTAYIVMAVSALASVKTGDALWFSRSGSIVILLCAIVEYRNFSIHQKLNELAQAEGGKWDANPERWKAPESRKIFHRVVLFTIGLGTIVWGYGDKLFCNT